METKERIRKILKIPTNSLLRTLHLDVSKSTMVSLKHPFPVRELQKIVDDKFEKQINEYCELTNLPRSCWKISHEANFNKLCTEYTASIEWPFGWKLSTEIVTKKVPELWAIIRDMCKEALPGFIYSTFWGQDGWGQQHSYTPYASGIAVSSANISGSSIRGTGTHRPMALRPDRQIIESLHRCGNLIKSIYAIEIKKFKTCDEFSTFIKNYCLPEPPFSDIFDLYVLHEFLINPSVAREEYLVKKIKEEYE
jgi:hypothetical protein